MLSSISQPSPVVRKEKKKIIWSSEEDCTVMLMAHLGITEKDFR